MLSFASFLSYAKLVEMSGETSGVLRTKLKPQGLRHALLGFEIS
jgi:hypothetical protein